MRDDLKQAISTMEGYSRAVHLNSINKGFWTSDNLSEKVMLTVTELAEAVEAMRKIHVDELHDKCVDTSNRVAILLNRSSQIQYGEQDQVDAINTEFKETIKDTVGDEFADTIIRLMDLSEYLGIDIWKHVLMKINYNSYRPYKHGKEF